MMTTLSFRHSIALGFTASALLLGAATPAFAERMRDMSLSVEDTIKQPSTTYTPKNPPQYDIGGTLMDSDSADIMALDPNMEKQVNDLKNRRASEQQDGLPNPRRGANSFDKSMLDDINPAHAVRGFMSSFCSDDVSTRSPLNTAAASCKNSQREMACERYQRATVDVQRLLDQVVTCENSGVGMGAQDINCDVLDAGRIDLLKQYWQDEDASYTILYLPDMVSRSLDKCARAGQKPSRTPSSMGVR
jgi:hypothetical protein